MLTSARRSIAAATAALGVATAMSLCAPLVAVPGVPAPAFMGPATAAAQENRQVLYIGDTVRLATRGYTPTQMEWFVEGELVKSCEINDEVRTEDCTLYLDYPAGTKIDVVTDSDSGPRRTLLVVKDPAEGLGIAGTREDTVTRTVGDTITLRADQEPPAGPKKIIWRRGNEVLKECEVASAADIKACSYTLTDQDDTSTVTAEFHYKNHVAARLVVHVGEIAPAPGEDTPAEDKQASIYTPHYAEAVARRGGAGGSHAPTFTQVRDGETFTNQPVPEGTTFEVISGPATVAPDGRVTLTAPEGLAPGETVPVTVKITYPDGSTDTTEVVFTLAEKLQSDIFAPAYEGERKAAQGKTITVRQSAEPSLTDVEFHVVEPAGGFGGWFVGIDKATGALTLTAPPAGGGPLTLTVRAVYADASTDELSVTVGLNSSSTDAGRYIPSPPGTIIVEAGGSGSFTPVGVPEGSTFDLVNDGNLAKIAVDHDTGRTDFTVPENAVPDATYLPTVDVVYPDGSENRVATPIHVASVAMRSKPAWDELRLSAGSRAFLEQTGSVPAGTTFGLPRSFTVKGWEVRIHETTGRLTVRAAKDLPAGSRLTIPVVVTFSDKSQREIPVKVVAEEGARGSSISESFASSRGNLIGLAVTVLLSLLLSLAASQRTQQILENIQRTLQGR